MIFFGVVAIKKQLEQIAYYYGHMPDNYVFKRKREKLFFLKISDTGKKWLPRDSSAQSVFA